MYIQTEDSWIHFYVVLMFFSSYKMMVGERVEDTTALHMISLKTLFIVDFSEDI